MATPSDEMKSNLNWRRYHDGEQSWDSWAEKIFVEDTSYKCPTYVHKTPPCQGSCPSGEDIRGYLAIARQQEKPPEGMEWQEYAFRRSTDANPFPSMMGRVCPAPCQDGCNRNEVDDYVGINAVEQYIGDNAIANEYKFEAGPSTGKKVAVIGGGPAGMAAAYQLRRKGHAVTVYEALDDLGGMMRFGIPNYRIPRDKLASEIQRILDMGEIDVHTKTRVGTDVSMEEVEKNHEAILWAIGCWSGRGLPVEGWDETPNCVTGVEFLKAFNEGRMKVTADKVVCVGGGDTSIDVVSVARRLGHIENPKPADRPELVVRDGYMAQDAALSAAAQGSHVTLTSLFPKENMTAAEHEVQDALTEGVTILDEVMPIGLVRGEDGRATGLKIAKCTLEGGRPVPIEGTEQVLEADLIVSAIGQGGDMTGLEELANERNLIDADAFYQVPGREKHFVAGDIIRPHLLTTAIGQASIAVDSIDEYLHHTKHKKRPKVDVHHFDLAQKLHEAGLDPEAYDPEKAGDLRGTASAHYAIHNFEDRSFQEIIPADELFLGHFEYHERNKRREEVPSADEVLGHFKERLISLDTDQTIDEAKRCMSCGMCFECDNCVIFCPQDAVYRVKKDEATTGRYVATDYSRCIGCHICADVCPTGYIKMGMGE